MVTMSPSATKEKAARQAQQMREIFTSWQAQQAQGADAEANNVFKSIIAATGATFQRMLAEKKLMEETMENEFNVAETCLFLMDEEEVAQRQERARALTNEQQAMLLAAAQQVNNPENQKDQAYTLMFKILNQEQIQALVALYGPSFV